MSFQCSDKIRSLASDIADFANRIAKLADDIDSEDDKNTRAHENEISELKRQIDIALT